MRGVLVAILMPDQEKAGELADQLATRGARTLLAASSDELYGKMGQNTVDVLVIAHQLNGFFTGLEITERVHADYAHPTTVLLAPEWMRENATVRRLRVFDVQPPNAAVDAIAEVVLRAAEKALQNRPYVCPRAQRLVARMEELQPLPPLMLKIAASLRDNPASPEDLFDDIAADPTASAAVLRMVNSSAIGRPQKTLDIAEGIRFLGLRRTVSAVLAAGWMQTLERLLSRAPKEVRRWYSRRSVLIASVAESLARNLEDLPPEAAYIHGLMQETGALVLAQAYGSNYVDLLDRVEAIPHLRLDAEERYQFATSHGDVTAALLRKLKLPEPLANICGRHHAPISDDLGSPADQALLRVLQIGEAVANIADQATPQRLITLGFLLGHYQGAAAGRCMATLNDAIQRVSELSKVLGLPAPEDSILAQLARDVRMHDKYAPDADFDPYSQHSESNDAAASGEEPPTASAADTNTPDPLEPPSRPRVLVLEDDPAVAKFISSVLQHTGIEVLHASHLHDALEMTSRVNAILCDIHLGDEDGVAAITALRSRGFTGPVIAISGDGCRSTVERACKARISEYLLKPFSKAQLLAKLEKYPGLIPVQGARPRGAVARGTLETMQSA